jgi:hypothetical protein
MDFFFSISLHTYIKVTQGDGCHIRNMLQTLVRGEQSMSARMNIDTEGEREREREKEKDRERGKHISGDPGRFDPDPHSSIGVRGVSKGDKTQM